MKTNAEIKKEVAEELKRNAILSSSDINVDVQCDTVCLSGKVDSYHKRHEAAHVLKSMENIKTVRLNIYVALPPDAKRSDEEISKQINKILNHSFKTNDIVIRVYDGIVVLTGEIDSEQQKLYATKIILNVAGIQNIWNFIRVRKNAVTMLNNKEINAAPLQMKESIKTIEYE